MSNCAHAPPQTPPRAYDIIDFDALTSDGAQDIRYQGARSNIICKLLTKYVPPLPVVIKAVRTNKEEDLMIAIENELRIWRLLDPNPNIARFLGTGQLELHPFNRLSLVAEYYTYGDVNKFLQHNELNDIERLELVICVLRGVSYIHDKKIVHGDLKGANVVIDGGGKVAKICDFGSSLISCDCYNGPEEQEGTSQWDSPELFEDHPRTSHSDIWAFGCIVLEVIMGMPPYGGISANEVMARQEMDLPPADEEMVDLNDQPSLHGVWKLMQSCWDNAPEKRPSASSLLVGFELKLKEDFRDEEGYVLMHCEPTKISCA